MFPAVSVENTDFHDEIGSTDDRSNVTEDQSSRWELVRQVRRALRLARWGLVVFGFVMCGIVLAEVLRFYSIFHDIHWLLGGYALPDVHTQHSSSRPCHASTRE